jgi:hypothetical protein
MRGRAAGIPKSELSSWFSHIPDCLLDQAAHLGRGTQIKTALREFSALLDAQCADLTLKRRYRGRHDRELTNAET